MYLIVSNALTSEPIVPQVSSAYAIPFIANNQTRVRFDKPEGREARAFENLVSRIVVNPMRLRGVEQKADLVHEYDKSTPTNEHSVGQIDEESEKEESEYMDNEEAEEEKKEEDEIASLGSSVSSLGSTTTVGEIAIAHQGLASKEFSDDTAVKINGIVMFEPSRTQGYTCGLPFAKIYAYSTSTDDDGAKVYTHFGTYLSDSSGRFEIGVPANGDYLFVVHGAKQDFGDDHEICYSGDTLDDIGCPSSDPEEKELSDPDSGQTYEATSYKEVTGASGTENLVFLDTTARTVDVGLYAGSCDTQYEDYTLLIMPANGCGATETVPSNIIQGWESVDGKKKWPYAAMDYYIQLDTAPDVSALNIEKIHATKDGATCTAGTEIMQYFRDRNKLVQTLLLLENPSDEAKFKYHGYFCSMIYYSNSDPGSKGVPTQLRLRSTHFRTANRFV